MADEEKSIEEIIAELERMEAKKAEKAPEEGADEGEKAEVFIESDGEQPPEELTLDTPREEILLEEPLEEPRMEPPGEPAAEEPSFDDIFAEKPQGAAPEELPPEKVPEEPAMELAMEESPEEMIVDTPREEIILEEPLEEPKMEAPDEPAAEEPSFDEMFAEKPESAPLEALRRDEVSGEPSMEMAMEEPFGKRPAEPPPEEPGEEPPEEPPALPPKKGISLSRSRMVLLFVLALAGLLSYAYFVWPTMYEYRSVSSADTKYKVKINRITKDQQYYDGGEWHSGPIPTAASQAGKSTNLSAFETARQLAMARVKAKAEAKAREKTPAAEPAKVIEKAPAETPEKEPTAAPKSVQVPSPPQSEDGVPSPQPVAEKKAEQPEAATVAKKEPSSVEKNETPAKEKQYIIQLGSMRFLEFAEEFVAKLKKKGLDAHMDSFKSKKTGDWYVVYVGRFDNREEAVEFLVEKDLGTTYPGSFVRALYLRAVEVKK